MDNIVFGGSIVITLEDFLEDTDRNNFLEEILVEDCRRGTLISNHTDGNNPAVVLELTRDSFMESLWHIVWGRIVWDIKRDTKCDFLSACVEKEANEFFDNGRRCNSLFGFLALNCLLDEMYSGGRDLSHFLVDSIIDREDLPYWFDLKTRISFLRILSREFPAVVPNWRLYIGYSDSYTDKLIQKQKKCLKQGLPFYFDEYSVENRCDAEEDVCRSVEENIGKVVAYYESALPVLTDDDGKVCENSKGAGAPCPIYIENEAQFRRSYISHSVFPGEILGEIDRIKEGLCSHMDQEKERLEELQNLIEAFTDPKSKENPDPIIWLITNPESPISGLIGKELKHKIFKLVKPFTAWGVFVAPSTSELKRILRGEEPKKYVYGISILYAVAYTLKMSYKTDYKIEGFYEYVVPPLEGFWWQEGMVGVDYNNKSQFHWISVIRLPDFVTEKDFAWAVRMASKKKNLDCSSAEFLTIDEGICVQIMHIGSFDNEPESVAIMDKFIEDNGYINDINEQRLHHEIYMSDARKVPVPKWKTVIRHPIKKA